MNRLVQLAVTAATALAVLSIAPGAAQASVPLTCGFVTSAIGSEPLQATVTLNCPGYAAGDAEVDDASLIGPATVSFYSGSDLEWTKTVAVPTAGRYKLSITITFNSDAGPITGTSTCCSFTVYGVAATPTSPPVTPRPATPRPATPRSETPRPATPRPAIPTATPVSTAAPSPSDSSSASPTEVPSPSASPSQFSPPEITASPTATDPPRLVTTSLDRGSDSTPALALGGLIALGLATVFLVLLVLWRKRGSRRLAA
jgi:hypothetical protein